jgi:hypothetical protein
VVHHPQHPQIVPLAEGSGGNGNGILDYSESSAIDPISP